MLCVVKADCYGHGAVPVANRLQSMGAPYFAVATVPEAVELRENGIEKPILILGYIDAADMDTVADIRHHRAGLRRARPPSCCQRGGRPHGPADITVHYKLDTGMTRIGFPSWECEETVRRISSSARNSRVSGARAFLRTSRWRMCRRARNTPRCSTTASAAYARVWRENGLDLPLRHCANSGAIQSYKQMHCTMTRAGIILYGYRPDASVPPVLDLRARHDGQGARGAGARHSGAHDHQLWPHLRDRQSRPIWRSSRSAMRTAFCARARERRTVLLGRQCTRPCIGRICMDMCMVRIPEGAQVHRGDEVTVFGPGAWTAEDAAEAAGTISYEVLCAVSRRVPRYCIG